MYEREPTNSGAGRVCIMRGATMKKAGIFKVP
jgi:hypothetical protein